MALTFKYSNVIVPWASYQHLIVNPNIDQSFVWCPRGQVRSFHPKDVKNRYCAWCHKFFEEIQE